MSEFATPYIKSYEKIAEQLPGKDLPWLQELRQAAKNNLVANGLPHQRLEDWKYTDISILNEQEFTANMSSGTSSIIEHQLLSEDFYHVVFIDGQLQPLTQSLPQGVTIAAVSDNLDCLANQSKDFKPGIGALNTLFLNQGVVINVADNCKIDKPIHLFYLNQQAEMQHIRNIITIGLGSECEFIESFVSDNNKSYLTTVVNEITCKTNSHTKLTKLQQEANQCYHIAEINVTQDADSNFTYQGFDLGSKLARHDVTSDLNGSGAQCNLYGLFMLNNRQHIDNHTCVNHNQPHTYSDEYFKGIADGRSRGVFNGKVVVKPQAQKIDAQQQSRNILLSDKAEIDTKPQLEIYADDVKCSHGATVGNLDEDSIFYLQSRGISEPLAKTILTFGFAEEVINKLNNVTLKKILNQQILQQLPDGESIKELL